MTYIKTLTAPLIIITGLALLTACAGGVAVTNNIGEVNINNGDPCTTEPFGKDCGDAYDAARVKRIEECLKDKAASTPTCNLAKEAHSCIDNPFATACASNTAFADYLTSARAQRTTYCDANPQETAFCAQAVEFNAVCRGNTDVFNTRCSNDSAGRTTACLANGIDAGAGGHATCAGILVTPCTSDPFTNSHCDDATDISGIRNRYCSDPATAWDDMCVVAIYSGTANARDMACLQYGIDVDTGGNALCSTRQNVIDACDMDTPFAHPVCDEVAGIDAGFRTTFCQIPANAFTTGCEQGTHGEVDAVRDRACLDGLPTATGCGGRGEVTMTCMNDPLSEPGCAKLPNYTDLLGSYCAFESRVTTIPECGTEATDVCPTNLFNPSAVSRTGTIDCLGDAAFAPARITACSTGVELNNCDTAEIAPEVCKASGASANPFAVFCATATNIGGSEKIAQIRQDALDACPDSTQDGNVGVCQNTISIRATLNTDCAMIANAFTDRCNYTQYLPARRGFCNTAATAWDAGCDGEMTYAGTTAMRDAACLANANADMANTGSDTRCAARSGIIMACDIRDPFRRPVCNNIAGIDAGIRTMYCTMQGNAFKAGCKTDGTHGTVLLSRTMACLTSPFKSLADPLCTTDMGAEDTCGMNPFIATNPGCRNLARFQEIVNEYCEDNTHERCAVQYSTWTGSFTSPALETTPVNLTSTTDRDVRFLQGLTTTAPVIANFLIPTGNFTTLTLAHSDLNGDEDDGVSFFTGKYLTKAQGYYAGILGTTDLGAPLNDAVQGGTWVGRLQAWTSTNTAQVNAELTLTVTFNGDGETNTISGFVKNIYGGTSGLSFEIKGDFNNLGVITNGEVNFANDENDNGILETSELSYTAGVLTGLIGQSGAVGAFHGNSSSITFAGGFVAQPHATSSDWVNSFNGGVPAVLTQTTVAANRKRQFLAGDETKLDDTLPIDPITYGLTFASAMYNGAALTGDNDIKDGFAGVVDTVSSVLKVYYVGILSGTDLGRPLTQTHGSITWNGQIEIYRADGEDISTDFSLKITLGEANGVPGSLGAIYGIVQSSSTNHYELTGTYDAGGIITGEVTYAAFTGSPLATAAPANGILTGLLGEHGAVGVFLAADAGSTKESIVGRATPTGGYAGGFVVSGPPPPRQPVEQPADTDTNKVAFNDWLRDFGGFPPLPTLTATNPATDRKREFLAGGTEGLATTGAVNVTKTITANLGTGNTGDGYHYFVDTVALNNRIPYAGLLSGTDLGARVTGTNGESVTWNGTLKATRNGTLDNSEDLALKITFGAVNGVDGSLGKIAGAVRTSATSGSGYELKGTYDASGVITGTVFYGVGFTNSGPVTRTTTNTNGILTGLIGAQGAVGVFLSGNQGSTKGNLIGTPTTSINNYVGGFVAAYTPPPPPMPSVATHANFKAYYADSARVVTERLHPTPTTTNATTAFLEGTATGLDTTGLAFPNNNTFMPVAVRLKEEETGDDGFALVYGTAIAGGNLRFRAGLLSGTDLGPALSGTSTATWAGSLHWANSVSRLVRVALPTVTVDFANGTIKTDAVTVRSNRTIAIDGLFGSAHSLPDGILGGDAIYTDGVPTRLPLIGLIGTEGAIGVFIGTIATVAGGFQASPN